MKQVVEIKDKRRIEKLFEGWEETLIWSCLQDCMGKAYTDSPANPVSAQIIIGDFCFLAGEPSDVLIRHRREDRESDFIIMVPSSETWAAGIEEFYKENAKKVERYAIKKEPGVFDRKKLQDIVDNCPEGFSLQRIDRDIYEKIMSQEWSRDLCSNFRDYEEYHARGMGTAVLKDGVVVSGASSYTIYNEGIEIEVDTHKDYRRRGLALSCCALLILDCLDRGLYPSWDAQNPGSVALSKKLGYHFDKPYTAYEVCYSKE